LIATWNATSFATRIATGLEDVANSVFKRLNGGAVGGLCLSSEVRAAAGSLL
jgi:hypothetical protein